MKPPVGELTSTKSWPRSSRCRNRPVIGCRLDAKTARRCGLDRYTRLLPPLFFEGVAVVGIVVLLLPIVRARGAKGPVLSPQFLDPGLVRVAFVKPIFILIKVIVLAVGRPAIFGNLDPERLIVLEHPPIDVVEEGVMVPLFL